MSDTQLVNHILIVIAMEAEAAPLLQRLNLTKIELQKSSFSPSVVYQGLYNNYKISVVTNGKCATHKVDNVGTTPAAISTFVAVGELNPDIIINAGTAGGFKRCGGNIGDAYIGTHFKHHDRRIPIPGFSEYGIGNHESFVCKNLVETHNFKSGVVSTGNSLDHTEKDLEVLLSNGAVVKDMEAAAIAWVADLSKTPFISLKVVTDLVDGGVLTQDEFLANLSTAAAILQEKLVAVIDFVAGRPLSEL